MRFVHDDEIPLTAQEALLRVLDARNPGNGRHHLVLVLPRVRSVVGPQDVASHDLELLAKLVLELSLPLEAKVGGRYDEGSLDQPSNLQLLEKQPRHDCLSGAGVVGQQKPDARQSQEAVIDGLELVRQRIDAGNRE